MSKKLIELGDEIKVLRKELRLSQETLADISGVDRAQLSKIEAGTIPGVTFSTIIKILEAMNMDLNVVKSAASKKYDIHPFVKWAGGKTQLLPVLNEYIPKQFNKYFEPFAGGGALFFSLQPTKAYINDNNEDLISAYKCFQDDELFIQLKNKLIEHEKNHSEEYYYQIRELDRNPDFNSVSMVDRAARLIYLNKSCFNGLFRVNSKGYFNVPFGKKEKVNCFDRDNFRELRNYIMSANIKFTSIDFSESVSKAQKGDFVYFDPPYDVLDDKNSFTAYDKNSFDKKEQERLANEFIKLDKKGVYVMLSNHNTKFINELYNGFNINVVNAKRMINSKGSLRGPVEEVIITNFDK